MNRMKRCLGPICALLSSLVLGCDAGTSTSDEPVGTPSEARPARALERSPSTSERLAVEQAGGRVTLRSDGAELGEILARLSQLGGFSVEGEPPPRRAIHLQLEEATWPVLLSRLLAGLPYAAAFSVDEAETGHVPKRLVIAAHLEPEAPAGEAGGTAARPSFRAPPGAARGTQSERRRPGTEALERRPTGVAVPPPVDDEVIVANLASSDPERRMEAVEEVDSDGAGLDILLELARDDPDAGVRALAVERLEENEGARSVAGIVMALEDPDPQVVLRAIEAVDTIGDETLAGDLEPLLDHRDGEVREAAQEAYEYLVE